MFQTFINAFKVKEIRKKILITLVLIVVYRLGCFIPIPGVNTALLKDAVSQYDILGFLDLLTGSSFSQFTIFAMGISPYINASIIMQLLTIAIPALERMNKEEDGRQKIEKITRYVGVALAMVQSIGIFIGLGDQYLINPGFWTYATIGICSTAGTAFLMWLGERITEDGVGNGVSMLIFASIVSRVPKTLIGWGEQLVVGTMPVWQFAVLIIVVVGLITLVTHVDQAQRRIPVQYAKRVVGRKMYGGQSTYLPIKANANGVLPLIFAMTFIQFPGMIAQFWPNGSFYTFYQTYLGSSTTIYFLIYALLIVGFGFFYSSITFNPIEMSKNLQQNGGFITGIRPGKPTSDFITKTLSKITLIGAVFLAIVAAVPMIIGDLTGVSIQLGGTSLLIIVGVALDTARSLEGYMTARHHKGFLE